MNSETTKQTAENPQKLRVSARQHREILALAALCLAILGVFKTDTQQVSLFGYSLPELCGTRAWFGMTCPGCGLTRSLTALLDGDITAAWHYHHLGWLVLLLIAGQIPYRIWALNHPPQAAPLKWPKVVGYTAIGALVMNWLFGMIASAS